MEIEDDKAIKSGLDRTRRDRYGSSKSSKKVGRGHYAIVDRTSNPRLDKRFTKVALDWLGLAYLVDRLTTRIPMPDGDTKWRS